MSPVAVGFVNHLQVRWRKCRIEFLSDGVAYGHDLGAPFWFLVAFANGKTDTGSFTLCDKNKQQERFALIDLSVTN
jgi:hypothetical protein